MSLKRFVMNTIPLAAMGLALTGVAYGQGLALGVPPVTTPNVRALGATDPGVADGAITRNGKLQADGTTNAHTPAVDTAAPANVHQNSTEVNTNAGAQTNAVQLNSNAAVGTEGHNLNSSFNSNLGPEKNVRLNGNQDRNNPSYNSGQDYTAGRPSYDMTSPIGNYSPMSSNQGYRGGALGCGCNGQPRHTCCSAPVQVFQTCHHARRYHRGRHHRHCCR